MHKGASVIFAHFFPSQHLTAMLTNTLPAPDCTCTTRAGHTWSKTGSLSPRSSSHLDTKQWPSPSPFPNSTKVRRQVRQPEMCQVLGSKLCEFHCHCSSANSLSISQTSSHFHMSCLKAKIQWSLANFFCKGSRINTFWSNTATKQGHYCAFLWKI